MTSLLMKDLILNKKYLGFALIYGLLMTYALQYLSGGQFAAITVGVGYVLMINAAAHEDKNNSEIILNCLPVSRRKIVVAKYLSIFIYAAIAFLSYELAILLAQLFRLSLHIPALTQLDIFGAVFALCLMSNLYYPIYFKLGFLQSNILKTLVFLIFFFSPGLLIELLKSQQKNHSLQSLIQFANSLSQNQLSSILLLLILVFTALSMVLSFHFYDHREF